jgi:LysR family hydrogen peroxide-inducible transcriptional activator
MTLTQLEYVLSVNKHRHFGRAAQACAVTQPTLSMQINKLEEELGVILFDRSKNPILPTQEGEAVIDQAQNVIQEYRKVFQVIEVGQKELVGEFRLGVIPTLSPYLVPLFVGDFCHKHPKLDLIIEEHKTEDIMTLLEKDELDAALLVTPLKLNNIVERTLFYEPFSLFISSDHSLSSKEKVKASELNSKGLWLLNEGHCMRTQMAQICSLREGQKSGQNLRFESGNLETLMNLVENYGGYTLIPWLCWQGLSNRRKKLTKEFSGTIPSREVSLVHRRIYLKERMIDALEKDILSNLPKGLQSHKTKNQEIIDI